MDMIEVSTIDYLPGYRITKSLGIVFSSKIMNQAIASDNTNIEEMLDTARQEANLGNNMIECQVSGMAVKAEKIDE